jgi:hypothetical protein
VDHKMAPEVAAERGVVVGQPYTPPGRTGTFDVPSYDDIADLQVLFKRFANTAASFTEAGGGPFVDKTGDFTVEFKSGLYKTYLCLSSTLMTVTVPDPATLTDGDRFNLIQGGTGKAEISGTNVVGLSQTAGQYQGVTATVHDGKWWCVPFGSSGGGATGPIPVFSLAESVTVDVTQAGGLLAMDASADNLSVTIPQTSEIPVGSAYVVSNVGDSTKNRVTIKGDSGVTILNRAGAVVERWRMASIVKQEDGSTTNGNDVWLLNAGGGGSGGSAPLPPKLTLAAGGPECAYLNWVAPEDDGGHDLTTYTVEMSMNGTDWALCATVLPSVTSTRVDNLTTGTKYEFRVKAGNVVGLSDPSNVLEATPTQVYNDAEGGKVTTYKKDGRTFRVHTFTTTGVFTVKKAAVPFSVLSAAGGGGGGGTRGNVAQNCAGGNGGAGGLLIKNLDFGKNTVFDVVVGTGGGGGPVDGGGGQGGNSKIVDRLDAKTIIESVGGGGGSGGSGGSGGGGGGGDGDSGIQPTGAGSGIAGQGNSGGGPGPERDGGGGGGAGGPGGGGRASGPGLADSITGQSVTYCGSGAAYGAGGRGYRFTDQNAARGGDSGSAGVVVISYEIAPFNDAEGGTASTYSKDGYVWRQHIWESPGTFDFKVLSGFRPFTIRMIGGGGNSGYADCPNAGGYPGGGGGGYDTNAYLTGTVKVTVGAANSTGSKAADGSGVNGAGNVGGGGNGCRGFYGYDWTAGGPGTWGGNSNGAPGVKCDGTGGGDPAANLRVLWDGKTGAWGKGGPFRGHDNCGANPGNAGMVAITYQIGVASSEESDKSKKRSRKKKAVE